VLLSLAAAIAVGAALWLRGGFALACGLGLPAGSLRWRWSASASRARRSSSSARRRPGLAGAPRGAVRATAATPHGRVPTDVQTLPGCRRRRLPATWAWALIAASLALVAGGLVLGAARPRPRAGA
jgi:hypothetical protein